MNMNGTTVRVGPEGADLDTAIEHARAALSVLLRIPGRVPGRAPGQAAAGPGQTRGGESGYPELIAGARALLGALLGYRFALAAERLDVTDPAAVASARADRDEAIELTAALLYLLAPGDPSWPDVAMTLGRLSYDRYSDPWPEAAPPDPDDLDAARDLLLRSASDETDERTVRYLVLALRDRQRLMPCPADAAALATWSRRLLAMPGRTGLAGPGALSRADLTEILAPELLHTAD